MARQAEYEIERLRDWNGLYRSFKRFASCDEGRIAEQFSYSVGTLLAKNWRRLNELLLLTSSDKDFEQFVVLHIDENIPEEQAQIIISNSRRHCPAGGERLCKSIADY